MNRLGIHFTLSAENAAYLRSLHDAQALDAFLGEVVGESEYGAQSDNWDFIHRALVGEVAEDLNSSGADAYPLNHVFLGGEVLHPGTELTLTLKTPDQVRDIAAALKNFSEEDFQRRYLAIDPISENVPLSQNECELVWESIENVSDFYASAADVGSFVGFFDVENEQDEVAELEYPSVFPEFGIHPDGLLPSNGPMRGFITSKRIAFEYLMTFGMVALGLWLSFYLWRALPQGLNWLGSAATLLGFAAFVVLGTRQVYHWIELNGQTLQAKRLFPWPMVQRSIDDIESVETLVLMMRDRPEVMVIEAMFGRVIGVDLRFRARRAPLRIRRVDPWMANAEELIETVLYEMSQTGELEVEMLDLDGVPLVGRVSRKGELGTRRKKSKLQIDWLWIVAGLLLGMVMGWDGQRRQQVEEAMSVPPQQMTLAALIENGPGDNLHVTITDFVMGKHVTEPGDKGRSDKVWLPLLPVGVPVGGQAKEIEVLYSSDKIFDNADLKMLLGQQQVTGYCSAERRSSWGNVLGPDLVEANQKLPLESAWCIDDVRIPPASKGVIIGSIISFCVAILFAIIVFFKGG